MAHDFRIATLDDCEELAKIITEVSAGVVPELLDGLLPGVSTLQVMTMVLRDTSSHFSHKNCLVADVDGLLAGLLLSYPSREQQIPALMRAVLPKKRLAPLEDLLTATVPESLYINTFWVASEVRGLGLSDTLMEYAKEFCQAEQLQKLSLFAWRDNKRALAFYARHGFRQVREVSASPSLLALHGAGDLYVCDLSHA